MSRVRAEIDAAEARISTAVGFAQAAEAELSLVQVPLDALRETNRALKEQIDWENGEWLIPKWLVAALAFLYVVVALVAGKPVMDADIGYGVALREATKQLEALRQSLLTRKEMLFAVALREVSANRALAIGRPALVVETSRHFRLETSLASAKHARLERERAEAARQPSCSDCGC